VVNFNYISSPKFVPRCIRLRNDLYCVGWGVELYLLICAKSKGFHNFGRLRIKVLKLSTFLKLSDITKWQTNQIT